MIRIYQAANLPEAHLLVELLRQAGIPARVFNQNAQSGVGEIPFINAWPEVWLDQDRHAERAAAVVRDYERRDPDPVPLACGECGEPNPGNFEVCWRCGRALV